MATYKVIHSPGKYQDASSYQDVLKYCMNPKKTPNKLTGGRNIDVKYAALEMESVFNTFQKRGNRIRHSVLSFSPCENISPLEVAKVTDQVADYYSARHQIVFAVHEDTDHPHAHFVMNHVSFRDGRHYNGTKQDYYGLQCHIKNILKPYGLSLTVAN